MCYICCPTHVTSKLVSIISPYIYLFPIWALKTSCLVLVLYWGLVSGKVKLELFLSPSTAPPQDRRLVVDEERVVSFSSFLHLPPHPAGYQHLLFWGFSRLDYRGWEDRECLWLGVICEWRMSNVNSFLQGFLQRFLGDPPALD